MRIVKEYDERYAEFLNVAQALFYSEGYERTSVKEIIKAVGVAKGTFYHYFDSKAALLEALVETLIERLYGQLESTLEPILDDEMTTGTEKFELLFARIGNWKMANPDFVWESVRVFYQDENVLLRAKMMEASTARMAPLFAQIIRQGVQEGSFDVTHPDEAAHLVFVLNQTLSEAVAKMMLAGERKEVAMQRMGRKVTTYERSIERILGAAEDSLHLIDLQQLEVWFPDEE